MSSTSSQSNEKDNNIDSNWWNTSIGGDRVDGDKVGGDKVGNNKIQVNNSNINFSLIDLNALSKPALKLIETVAEGIGLIFEPTHIRREARAKRDAIISLALADKVAEQVKEWDSNTIDLQVRAVSRINQREFKRQNNLERIIRKALDQLPEFVNDNNVDQDWVDQFLNYAQDVTNDKMQQLWAKVLAGEVTEPGSFSLRTLNSIKFLQAKEALIFQKFCDFIWQTGDDFYCIEANILGGATSHFTRHAINWYQLKILEHLGLILFTEREPIAFYHERQGRKPITLTYFDKVFEANNNDYSENISTITLSPSGIEIFSLCDRKFDDDYFDYLMRWNEKANVLIPV